ncbi:PH domain-containing protein [Streptomyces sp. NPDC021749]|uniref:PH domain-containing protein n=1 Tax=Streptomyces sp. NPDC021749 TaxID=3154905 RepID=UPI0033E5152B
MLAVHPLHETFRLLPVVLGVFILGHGGEKPWSLIGLAPALAMGLGRYFTTRYRVTGDHVQVSRGLLRREVLSVRRERIRSVDVSAGVLQRVLGLRRLAIGTGRSGRGGEGLVLNALDASAAERLRSELLHRADRFAPTAPQSDSAQDVDAETSRPHPDGGERPGRTCAAKPRPSRSEQGREQRLDDRHGEGCGEPDAAGEEVIAVLRPAWARFGAFTLSGLAGLGVLLTSAVAFLNAAELGPERFPPVRLFLRQLSSLPTPLAVGEVAVLAVVAVSLLGTLGYVVSFGNFRLTRRGNGTLHLTRGVVTTRSVTIEERRLRGVEISETLPLRLVRGARCTAIATGLRGGRRGEEAGSLLLPPVPLARAREVGAAVYGNAAPMDCLLTPHGEGARRRRLTRAWTAAVAAVALTGALSLWAGWPPWLCPASLVLLPLAEWVGRDRYRNLGHALLEGGHLVIRQGSLVRRRQVLSGDAAVGWVFHESFIQRRSGVAHLTMATAAGRQHYSLLDLPLAEAAALAAAVQPDWLAPLLVGAHDAAEEDDETGSCAGSGAATGRNLPARR